MPFHRRAILVCLSISLGIAADRAHAAEEANSISNVAVRPDAKGRSSVHFDYFFNGEGRGARLEIEVTRQFGEPTDSTFFIASASLQPETGSHHAAIPVVPRESTTARVQVSLIKLSDHTVLLRQEIFAKINGAEGGTSGPDPGQARNEQDLAQAIELINEGGSSGYLQRPRTILEQLIARDPRFDPAYVELARIAMKANWGPEGLHQAELLLDSALKIRPESVNAKILMGYVYTHQMRYAQAQALFIDAARSNPPNVWLWANWGELLVMQGKEDEAITRYRQAIAKPGKNDVYANARFDAYQNLLKLLAKRNDVDGMEAVYKQHAEDGAQELCINIDYARFLLTVRGNAQRAIEVLRHGVEVDTACGSFSPRQITGLANYLIWAQSEQGDGLNALNQARIYLPAGARTFYLLATSDKTMSAARKLLGAGESIDQKDNAQMTALGHALQAQDGEAAARLLTLGARPDAPVGSEGVPVALLPVFEGDLDAIRALRRAGVDYSKIRYKGLNALEVAKRSGDSRLLEALTGKPRTL